MNPMTPIPVAYYPQPATAMRLHRDYGSEVDLRLILEKFRAYYAERGETSRDWDAKFVVWVIRDVQQVRDQRKGGTDELGVPHRQSKATPVALTPDDPGYVSLEDLAEEARRMALSDSTEGATTVEDTITICPECRNGKHPNCTERVLDLDTDKWVTCDCRDDSHDWN